MNILHITASPRGAQGASRALSNLVVERLLARHPGAGVTLRELAGGEDEPALPHIDAAYALALSSAANEPGFDGAQLRSDGLIEELVRADIVVIGTPMHNLTVPSTLKSWIDHVVRLNRTMRPTPEGKVGNLHDHPVYLAISAPEPASTNQRQTVAYPVTCYLVITPPHYGAVQKTMGLGLVMRGSLNWLPLAFFAVRLLIQFNNRNIVRHAYLNKNNSLWAQITDLIVISVVIVRRRLGVKSGPSSR